MRCVGQSIPHGIDRRRTRVDQFSIRNGKKPGKGRNMRGKQGRGFQRKKNVKGKTRNRCCDSPWKPWTLIARWRSRCKSAFPATVMIAGVVSASTCASQTVLRRTPQSREKTVDHFTITRSRTPNYLFSLFYPCLSRIRRREQRNSVEIIVVGRSAISVRVYPRNAILIAYASGKMRIYAFLICYI